MTEALIRAVELLGDVQHYCPDRSEYRYLVVSTKGILFEFAIGMNIIAFRLNTPFNQRALATGGDPIPELGDEWVGFVLFRNDWPEADLLFWHERRTCTREKQGPYGRFEPDEQALRVVLVPLFGGSMAVRLLAAEAHPLRIN